MSEKKAEEFIHSHIGHKRIKKDTKTTTYIVYGLFKLKNNPKRTRWSLVKKRLENALRREFGDDLVS